MNSPEKEKREQETYESFFAESDQQKSPLRPQPKVEWSEEDNEMRLEAIRVLESGCKRYINESHCLPSWWKVIEWLRYLHPQYHGDVTMTEAYKMGKEAGKQEQKPVDYNEYKMLIDGAREDGKIKGRKEVIDHPDKYGLTKRKPAERSLEDDHIIGFVYDLLNEIEWKDSWAMSKDECLRLLNNYSPQKPADLPAGFYVTFPDGRKYYTKEMRCNGMNVKVVAPKPAEWSEEDNIGWDEAFACVTRAEKAAKNEEELQNAVTAEKWLKEIKFKYYVHPVKQEWSEEDENALKYLHELISFGYAEKFMDAQTAHDMREWVNTSLRPQPRWKPSEEQMEVLLNIEGGLRAFQYNDKAKIIAELYEQLKRL